MQFRRFNNKYFVRIDRGEEIMSQLKTFCEKEKITLAEVKALGAVDDFEVGLFDVVEKKYHRNNFKFPAEIVSLWGTVTTKNGKFYAHLHLSAADKDGKVSAIDSDVVSASFEFDAKGETSTDTAKVTSKKEAGVDYGMAANGQDLNGDGNVKEWFEQADVLDEKIIGKKADEITALAMDTGYGVEDVQKAGCTINIADMIKAAVKACK